MAPARLLAMLLAVAVAALASPAPTPAADTTTAVSLQPTAIWVSVGSDGTAKTITPVLTTIDGTPTVLSAEPTTTATGTATTTDQPEATATSGAGSFPVCNNVDGELAPFCAPSDGSTLHPGSTYYITWDPSFFATSSNTTVIVTGNRFNATTGAITTQAFSSSTLAASWSFYAWTVDKAVLDGATSRGVNISISMAFLGSANHSTQIHGPIVTVANPEPYRQKPAEAPSGAALYIGLPCVLAFIILMVVGTCVWNRRARRIGLGNVMGRARGYGVRKSRRQRVGAVHLDSKDAIRLQTRDVRAAADAYSDAAPAAHGPPALTLSDMEPPRRPRRDSDSLGSLAGTPTEDRFGGSGSGSSHPPAGTTGTTGNAFRDELRRQENLL